MELGGNAPLIVFEDADWTPPSRARCSPRCATSARPAPPPTASTSTRAVADAFTARFTAAMAALKVGDGTDPRSMSARWSTPRRATRWPPSSPTPWPRGAKLELRRHTPDGPGFFYPPTVLSNVPETADCVHDEIFGPVAAIQTFADRTTSIARANDTEYGLVAYVFSAT
jgi:succinate-semialdehyde dehydrogenase / glutarate-semialdehyde dehydrogenase